MKVFLIRHAETKHNLKNYIVDDDKDSDLSDAGIKAAFRLKEAIIKYDIGNVYVSSYRRTTQTAKILFPDKKILTVQGFREIDKGFVEFLKHNPSLKHMSSQAWEDSYMAKFGVSYRFVEKYPSGESISDMYQRTNNDFYDLLKKNKKSFAIVANNGPIKCILSKLSNNPESFYFRTKIPYCSISVLSIDNHKINIDKIANTYP